MQTLAGEISSKTLETITAALGLIEIFNKDGGPFLPLVAPAFGGASCGSFRLWDGGDTLLKLVYTGITVEQIGLDSHMIFAFTKPDSIVPTFTLDSVYTRMPPGADPNFPDGGDMYAFHLDLIPKCDLGINYAYIKHAYEPLTELQAQTLAADGIFPAELSPTQRAIMSPWMLAQRVSPEAYRETVFPTAAAYTSHWLRILEEGMDDLVDGLQGEFGAARDLANRQLIFNRDVDPVWAKIDMMVGNETSDSMIDILRNQAVEAI